MISQTVIKTAHIERWPFVNGEPILPVNVCARCGQDDDPQDTAHWEKDVDDHRVCPACLVPCLLCNDPTTGSRSVNGHFCAALCQECRDVEDHAADMALSGFAETAGRVLNPIPLATEVLQ